MGVLDVIRAWPVRLARAIACAILGHRSNIADRKTFATIALTHDGPAGVDRGRWIYEPCSRCGALFCLEFGTPEAVQLPVATMKIQLPAPAKFRDVAHPEDDAL